MLFRLLVVSICLYAAYAAPLERDQTTVGTASLSEGSCGLTPVEPLLNPKKKIETAQPHSWPWMAALCVPSTGNESELDCAKAEYGSGTVVGRRWVLTILKEPSQDVVETMRVRTGVHDRITSPEEPDSRLYNISRVHEFPYVRNGTIDGKSWTDDTAVTLIELATDIHFDETVQPVCLSAKDGDSKDAWVTGWRRSRGNNVPPEAEMSQMHLRSYLTGLTQLVAVDMEQQWHKNMLTYEQGAPLVKKHDGGRWFQYGILYQDFLVGAMYASGPYYCEWIEQTTRGEVKCQSAE